MTAVVLRGDARNLPLPDASVDLIVTSPPYYALRSYTDGGEHYDGQIGAEPTPAEYVAALLECTAEWVRVLKPSGSLWVNLGDKYSGNETGGRLEPSGSTLNTPANMPAQQQTRTPYRSGLRPKSLIGLPWRYALGCIDQLGLILRAEVIWSKPNGLPESVRDRVRRSHEQFFHFTKQPRYFAAVDEIRQPHVESQRRGVLTWEQRRERSDSAARYCDQNGHGGTAGMAQSPLGKLPGSVWDVATQPLTVPEHLGVDHFAAFPAKLIRPIILGWSPTAGTVLDPFGGTGTTALVADVHGRHGISIDMSADYCRLAQWRTQDPRERARALGVKPPDPVAPDQPSLFEDIA